MSSKPVYSPFIDKNTVLCSRCFAALGDIEKYGCDEKGIWFFAPCSQCGAKMRWYRQNDGTPTAEKETDAPTENTFSFHLENGEITMKSE